MRLEVLSYCTCIYLTAVAFLHYNPFATPFAEHQSGESKALTKASEQCKTGDNR
jgi:hypothetical protein